MNIKTIGVLLVLTGTVMMIYTGFSFITDKKIIDSGAVKIYKEQPHFFHWPPFIGVVLFVIGIILVIRDRQSAP